MVRTRGSAGIDVGVCTGGHWRGHRTKRCYRFTRAGKLARNPSIRCESGCFAKKCSNYDVCEIITVSSLPGNFCHLCTYLLACKKIHAADGGGECPVCMEEHSTVYKFPGCETHACCGPCMKRILFGDTPSCGARNYAQKVWKCVADDERIFTIKQQCPICRASDTRPFLDKFCAMEKEGTRALTNEFAVSARKLILQTMKAALAVNTAEAAQNPNSSASPNAA